MQTKANNSCNGCGRAFVTDNAGHVLKVLNENQMIQFLSDPTVAEMALQYQDSPYCIRCQKTSLASAEGFRVQTL